MENGTKCTKWNDKRQIQPELLGLTFIYYFTLVNDRVFKPYFVTIFLINTTDLGLWSFQ